MTSLATAEDSIPVYLRSNSPSSQAMALIAEHYALELRTMGPWRSGRNAILSWAFSECKIGLESRALRLGTEDDGTPGAGRNAILPWAFSKCKYTDKEGFEYIYLFIYLGFKL